MIAKYKLNTRVLHVICVARARAHTHTHTHARTHEVPAGHLGSLNPQESKLSWE